MTFLKQKIVLGLFLLITTTSCNFNIHQSKNSFIGKDEVAFIEFYQTLEGEVISGTQTPSRRIDGPTYRFDRTEKTLQLLRKDIFSIDTVSVILGNGRVLKGASGSGISNRITLIGKLPYTMNNFTINKINKDGIFVTFNRKEFVLKAGEEWQTTDVSIDTTRSESPTITKTKITYTINYFGKIDKKAVRN
jgi:hypothetical protein